MTKEMCFNMSEVLDCSVTECAYNVDRKCRTMAINVGGSGPLCDAFIRHSSKAGMQNINGGVGACKMENCKYNKSLECSAEGIHVELLKDKAECITFTAK